MQGWRGITNLTAIKSPHFMSPSNITCSTSIYAHDTSHGSAINIFLTVSSINQVPICNNRDINTSFTQLKTPDLLACQHIHSIDRSVSITRHQQTSTIDSCNHRYRVGCILGWTTGSGHPNQITSIFIEGKIAMPSCNLISPTRIQITNNNQKATKSNHKP